MTQALPFFSVIVPTFARPVELKTCVEGFVQLAYPRDRFELIVVDDGSPSSMEFVVAPFRKTIDVRVIVQANAGPAVARNAGAAAARGELLAFTDDDCTPHPNWLDALADRLKSTPSALVGGQTLNALPDNSFAEASQQLISYLYDYYNVRTGEPRFFTSNNMAVSADRFRQLEGFNTGFAIAAGEDRDLCERWRHAGLPMRYEDGAVTATLTIWIFGVSVDSISTMAAEQFSSTACVRRGERNQ